MMKRIYLKVINEDFSGSSSEACEELKRTVESLTEIQWETEPCHELRSNGFRFSGMVPADLDIGTLFINLKNSGYSPVI